MVKTEGSYGLQKGNLDDANMKKWLQSPRPVGLVRGANEA
jgi:hypothetical protein